MSDFQPNDMGSFLRETTKRLGRLERSLGGLLRPKTIGVLLATGVTGSLELNGYGSRLVVLAFALTATTATPGTVLLTLANGARPAFAMPFRGAAGWDFQLNPDGTLTVFTVGSGTNLAAAVSFTAAG